MSDIPPPSPPSSSNAGAPGTPPDPNAPATSDERTYALLVHLSTLVFPLLGPLVLWLVKKDTSSFIDHHGKEAVNFRITVLGVWLLLLPVAFLTCGFGSVLYLPVFVADLVFTVLAAVAANEGKRYRYPYCFRAIS